MKILVSIYCYGFYRRLHWMLKSLKEQSVPIDVNVSIIKEDPYYNEEIISELSEFANFKVYDDMDFFSQRHNPRNDDLQDAKGKYNYICFCDGDLIFSPKFFEELMNKDIDNEKLLSVPRPSYDCEIEDVNELCKSKPVDGCYEYLSKKWRIKSSKRCVGAGYFQMVNLQTCIDKKINYGGRDRPITSEEGQKARSDIKFRRQFAGIQKIRKMKANIVHLRHEKGNAIKVGAR